MKVLLVEDDRTLRTALGKILEGSGREVAHADTVETGLARASDADVILLDLKLGADSGERFLELLRNDGKYTPVVVLSGMYPKEEALGKLKKYQIVDFIEKPFKLGELLGKILDAEKVAKDMECVSESADRFARATASLRKVAGKAITEFHRP